MFALVAAFIAFLAAFGVGLGSVNMLLLALAFYFLHCAFSWSPWPSVIRRNNA